MAYLEWPWNIWLGPPHYKEGKHGHAIEEGGSNHVHVEQLADIPHHDEDDGQHCLLKLNDYV